MYSHETAKGVFKARGIYAGLKDLRHEPPGYTAGHVRQVEVGRDYDDTDEPLSDEPLEPLFSRSRELERTLALGAPPPSISSRSSFLATFVLSVSACCVAVGAVWQLLPSITDANVDDRGLQGLRGTIGMNEHKSVMSAGRTVPEFCGKVDFGVEYHTRQPLHMLKSIPTPAMCCAECDGDPECGAWVWGNHTAWDGKSPTCLLKRLADGEIPQTVRRAGIASGLQRLRKHGIVAGLLAQEGSAVLTKGQHSDGFIGIEDNETCRGNIDVNGQGSFSVVNAQWQMPFKRAAGVDVPDGNWEVVPHLESRAYLAESCTPDEYNRSAYASFKMLGKTFHYTTDLSGAGCGCNAKLHLVPMQHNVIQTSCRDYFCSVANTCGAQCAEISLQDANQYAWSSALHVHDHVEGVSVGYGGAGWDGRREWNEAEYGPGAECIDTSWPFNVAISFPVLEDGSLEAVEVKLSQDGHYCPLKARMENYRIRGRNGMEELSKVLAEGVTPFISYHSSSHMAVIDGIGNDGRGPCVKDAPEACPKSVRFYGFSINETTASPFVSTEDVGSRNQDVGSRNPLDVAFGQLHEKGFDATAQRHKAAVDALATREELENDPDNFFDNFNTTPPVSSNSTNETLQADDGLYPESKPGHPEWEVMFSRLPVRAAMNFSAKILNLKLKGQVVHGKRIGKWVELIHEPGYVALWKKGISFLKERVITYNKITQGTCEEAGMFSILDTEACKSASFALGYYDQNVTVYTGSKPRPEGCYLRDGQLWLSTHPNNKGNGATRHRLPICGTKAYPTTTTTTTTTSTSSTSKSSTTISSTTSTTTATTTSSTTWGFPNLFCYSVMMRHGCGKKDCYEYNLMRSQVRASAGIFLCEDFAVLSQDEEMSLGNVGGDGQEVITQQFKKAKVGKSDDGFAGNTELFIHVWDVIGKDGRWAKHHWTIKADPDAVILASRIRNHLRPHTNQNNYVPNCNQYPSSDFFPMVYGSFEAFSRLAMDNYYNRGGSRKCATELHWQTWGEDKYMGECMKHLGVGQATDLTILSDKRCGGSGSCTDGVAGAYHDFKSIPAWFHCWHEATGYKVMEDVTMYLKK